MAVIPHPPEVPGNLSDKIQHAAAFATLGILGRFAYPRVSALRLVAGLSVFGALIEIAQSLPIVHRDSDPLDWIADTVACAIVLLGIRIWRSGSS
jgi:VanZ family protein